MSRVTLSLVTCPLDVYQIGNLGNFVARDMQMFLVDTKNNSCLRDSGACCWPVTRMFSFPGRHAEYNVTRDMSPSLAIDLPASVYNYFGLTLPTTSALS